MKARLAAVLSIAGVLVAGSAAAVVNTRVLENDTGVSATPVAAASSTPTTVLATTPATAATAPSTASTVVDTTAVVTSTVGTPAAAATTPTAPTAAAAAAATASPQPGPAQETYALGPGGSVTLDASGGTLTIARVDPAPGWEVHDARNESPTRVRVRVRSDDGDVRLEASLVFGVISTSIDEDLDD